MASPSSSFILIPGLPNDLSASILASLPYAHQVRLRSTARSWRELLSAKSLIPLRRLLRLPPTQILAIFPADPAITQPCLFDPTAKSWTKIKTLPCDQKFYARANFAAVFVSPHMYLIGGSQFDVSAYPIFNPAATAQVHRIDMSTPAQAAWERMPEMSSPRGGFACAGEEGIIVVAGGGAQHPMCPYVEDRMNSVELFDVERRKWRTGRRMPRHRAGCTGLMIKREGADEEEFWVMGGFGDYQAVAGVVPRNVYYRDALVLGIRTGRWREVGEMWGEGERGKLGPVVAINGEDGRLQAIFMLDGNHIFRYDFSSNRWIKESSLRKKVHASSGFVGMNRELYVLTSTVQNSETSDGLRAIKRKMTLEIQIYNPEQRKWRFLTTNPPLYDPIDFKTAVACTIQF